MVAAGGMPRFSDHDMPTWAFPLSLPVHTTVKSPKSSIKGPLSAFKKLFVYASVQ